MRIRKIIFTSLLIVLFACMPAFASISLEVDNQPYEPSSDYLLNNGITFVGTQGIGNITGADVSVDEQYIHIVNNDNNLKLTLGQAEALLNDKPLSLAAAPYATNDKIMLPLRSIAEALGAKVMWDSDTRTVNISFSETKNDLSAADLLAQTNAILNDLPSYDMDGSMKTKLVLSGLEEEGFPIDVNMDSTFYAHYEKEPLLVYTKQSVNIGQIPDMPVDLEEMEIEAVLVDNNYYINSPEIGWIKMDLEGLDFNELMQTFSNQDPAAMLKQMQDFGMKPTFSDDVEINGQKYLVVDVTIDNEKFVNEYIELLESLPIPEITEVSEELYEIISKTDFDISYTNYINASTIKTDFIKMNMGMKIAVPLPEEDSSEVLEMDINIQADLNVKEAEPNFKLPDLSTAEELAALMD